MEHELIFTSGPTVIDYAGGVIQPIGGSSELFVDASMLRNGGEPYHSELQYLALLKELVDKADADPTPREDRTGTGTYSVFGRQMRFDLSGRFPLLTTKKVFMKGIIAELLWMLSGSTDAKVLQEQNVHIWDEWCKDGTCDLGPVYGKQWRAWETNKFDEEHGETMMEGIPWTTKTPRVVDQIANVIKSLKNNPNSRRHIVTAWNPADIEDMALPPCHLLFQFYVDDGKLSCQLYQRSGDIFLGVPFNIASYALLTILIAREVGLKPGEFIHTFGDLHLYANHVNQAKEQLTRTPMEQPIVYVMPQSPPLFELKASDIGVLNYLSHPPIKAEVSV